MEICSNCLKKIPQEYLFCPYCGYPHSDITFKNCPKGHLIFETYINCPLCTQVGFKTKESSEGDLLNRKNNSYTELLTNYVHSKTEEVNSVGRENENDITPYDKTVIETISIEKTVLEEEPLDKTRFESIEEITDRTVLEADLDKTILDVGNVEPLPPFFAWLVFVDEQNKPQHDVRLIKQKNVIGKSVDADIFLKDDFASKFHAVIHYDEGKFFLSDLGSTNHTWLNDKKIMNDLIEDGDKIRIGRQNLIFKRVRRSL